MMSILPESMAGGTGKGHILVVDDSEPVGVVVSRAAGRLGYTADLVFDGPQALTLFAANAGIYALAFVDLKLPGGMNGAEVIRELRLIRPDIPAVMTSGYSLEEAAPSMAGLDCVGYLQKPFRLDTLATALQQALDAQLRRESM
jgi:two-component system, cell cycle sensor histidine kinase and response regulator CckA